MGDLMSQPQNNTIHFDDTDFKILRALNSRARIPMNELAREIGMSAPSTTERVRRLEEAGIIRGYTINLDLNGLGFGITAIVRIKPRSGQLHIVEKFIQDEPRFVSCDKVTGEDCFVARICLRSINELDAVLDPLHLRAETNTSIVTATPVGRRLPIL
jgi:Lrp/AsnC family transcriptional regulator, leucine-responsive regulatory protein